MSKKYFYMNNGKYIAIDPNSGGYPYETENPLSVNLFFSIDRAEKYKAMFSKEWVLCEFKGINYEQVEIKEVYGE